MNNLDYDEPVIGLTHAGLGSVCRLGYRGSDVMKIVTPKVEIITPLDGEAILRHVELCGRVCYKSEARISDGSSHQFVANIIARGHESVLEHYSFSVRFICDRGVSHEIVRHRLASYSQESTRYCNYGQQGEISFIQPSFNDDQQLKIWRVAMEHCEQAYLSLLAAGASPQMARSVLPNSLKTELVMTANLREWRLFIKLRGSMSAHPQIRELVIALVKQLKERIPVVFDDLVS